VQLIAAAPVGFAFLDHNLRFVRVCARHFRRGTHLQGIVLKAYLGEVEASC